MNVADSTIDDIVRQVLQQLRSQSSAAPAAAVVAQPAPVVAAPVPPTKPAGLTLAERVITGDLLQERLNGARQIFISPKAVLTPSARDILRQRNVEVSRETPTAGSVAKAAKWLALVSTATPAVQSALSNLTSHGASLEQQSTGTADEAAREVICRLSRGAASAIIVFTREPHRVACLANRQVAVRAACATDPQSLASIRKQVSPNVWCVNPENVGYFPLKRLIQACIEHTPTTPPDWQ